MEIVQIFLSSIVSYDSKRREDLFYYYYYYQNRSYDPGTIFWHPFNSYNGDGDVNSAQCTFHGLDWFRKWPLDIVPLSRRITSGITVTRIIS